MRIGEKLRVKAEAETSIADGQLVIDGKRYTICKGAPKGGSLLLSYMGEAETKAETKPAPKTEQTQKEK